jgi:N-methylhydantoinase A/oxoprolinase/acetone carboxylase beta subunit
MTQAGIDTGGTFTDCIAHDGTTLHVHKRLSTPQQPAIAVLAGLQALGPGITQLLHGTTVATNALLERKAAPTAWITTAGFADLIEIGRQNRPSLYDLKVERPQPLVDRGWRYEVAERISAEGEILTPLTEETLAALDIPAEAQSLGIGFLFSWRNPAHEQQAAAYFRARGYTVSASHEVVAEYREYERFSTTAANAALLPIMQRYMAELQQGLQGLPCHLVQSNGGSLAIQEVAQQPVRCVLSGPAAGVAGAVAIARALALPQVLTFDMGGTSTDVALIDGEPLITTEAVISGLPLKTPMLAIHTVGAGGGSLARVDAGGALRVGPESAGANPGPICYGQGHQLTVTDANLFLGRLRPEVFLGGEMQIYKEPVVQAMQELAQQLDCSPEAAALGLIAVANSHMEQALRAVSIEQGYDPADFTLFSFGGAGGLHACALAQALDMRSILIPVHAGVFSALGMLYSDRLQDRSRTVYPALTLADWDALEAVLHALTTELPQTPDTQWEPSADLRYVGQSFELTVPWGDNMRTAFDALHHSRHGYSRPDYPVEIVTVRQRARIPAQRPVLPNVTGAATLTEAQTGTVDLWLDQGPARVPCYQREALPVDQPFVGPALILEPTTTTLVAPGFHCQRTVQGHLLLNR